MRSARNFLKAFTSIFKKKKIIFPGRAGMTYFDEGRIYFIDSELLGGDDADVVIYDGKIYYTENNAKVMLSESERNEVLKKVETEMDNIGLIVIMPDRYIRWRDLIR